MSSKGDKVCPLCTEEMDLTDQQLKPCKCGYEICVWCWNHIMEIAERDNTEGRCPACRTAYDKEKIVGMAASCERLVAEINSERKHKSQKAKSKTAEGRMHLSNVRVIQRHLVYIIGLPLNLADESLLQRREYFGQYGKVLKVSISRTATGAIQHSSNNSCCIYITYSKEEEAVRCIQSVHSFVLEGRPLRACFGTTKYCHAWLKNTPCSIPDCLYLHDFGSQEDSFTKDDLVSAFTRSRVQQIIGATNNLHHRSGDVLPPPADECTNRNIPSMVKLDSKTSSHNIEKWDGGSGADIGDGRPNALPGAASWVMRVSANLIPAAGSSLSVGTPNHKPETSNGPHLLASEALSTKESSDVKRMMIGEGSYELQPTFLTTTDHFSLPSLHDIAGGTSSPPASSSPLRITKLSNATGHHELENYHEDGDFQGLCSQFSSISFDSHLKDEYDDASIPGSSVCNNLLGSEDSTQDVSNPFELSASPSTKGSMIVEDVGFEGTDHVPSNRHLKRSTYHSWKQVEVNHQNPIDAHQSIAPKLYNEVVLSMTSGNLVSSNGFCNNQANTLTELDKSSNCTSISSDMGSEKCLEAPDDTVARIDNKVGPDTGESSIISNILSMDFDEWEDPLTSPQSLVKLLVDTDKSHGSFRMPCLRKTQDSSQSRFSFARQDDFFYQVTDLEHSFGRATNRSSLSRNCIENKDLCRDKYHDISSKSSYAECSGFLGNHPFTTPSFSTTVSKTSTSPPPGFLVPSRAAPPGFPTHGTVNNDFHHSGNNLTQNSTPPSRNVGVPGDAEFPDPAMLNGDDGIFSARLSNAPFDARPTLSPQLGPFDHDTEHQKLMRLSRFPDYFRYRFSPQNDAYGILPMRLGNSPPNKPPAFSQGTPPQLRSLHMPNGPWDGWNETKNANDLGMPEFLTNGSLEFKKFIPSYEDLKFRASGSGNIYNRGFAM